MSVMRSPSFAATAVFLALATLLGAAQAGGDLSDATEPFSEVDVALVVAVDVSQSVDEHRYRLQMEGIAKALEDPEVVRAISSGAHGLILFTVIAWADGVQQILDWQSIGSVDDSKKVAALVRNLPHVGGEFTCMARMLKSVALRIVPDIPLKADRIVLDVSGDGIDNCSDREAMHEERDRVVALPATINGLPIIEPGENDIVGSGAYRAPGYGLRQLSNQPDKDATTLDLWYMDHVVGGNGAFLLVAQGYDDFGRAMRQKFVTEISSTNICDAGDCRVASCSETDGAVRALCRM